jgi:hypothetical protein
LVEGPQLNYELESLGRVRAIEKACSCAYRRREPDRQRDKRNLRP